MHTDPHKPSLSLLTSTCYPEACQFSSAATKYGCQHEKDAVEAYKLKLHSGTHDQPMVTPCGFVVSTHKPLFGASPDAFVECNCCGRGVLEVKCPFCARSSAILVLPNFCLTKDKVSSLHLKHDNAYYYQYQLWIGHNYVNGTIPSHKLCSAQHTLTIESKRTPLLVFVCTNSFVITPVADKMVIFAYSSYCSLHMYSDICHFSCIFDFTSTQLLSRPLVNAGNSRLAPIMATLSATSNPSSAKIISPGSRLFRYPECSVIYLSEVVPPQPFEMKLIEP